MEASAPFPKPFSFLVQRIASVVTLRCLMTNYFKLNRLHLTKIRCTQDVRHPIKFEPLNIFTEYLVRPYDTSCTWSQCDDLLHDLFNCHIASCHRVWSLLWQIAIRTLSNTTLACSVLRYIIREPFEKFVDSHYYSESELCGGAVTVSFSKYLPWKAMHFFTTLHPLLENVLQTVCRERQEDSGTGDFDLLITSKFRNLF
jgi:hypothetical protein